MSTIYIINNYRTVTHESGHFIDNNHDHCNKKPKSKPKSKPLRQFKRRRKNPAHSNRHIYTMKDMRA